MHNFNNINCRSITVSCLITRAATAMAPATGGVTDSSGQQRTAANTGLLAAADSSGQQQTRVC